MPALQRTALAALVLALVPLTSCSGGAASDGRPRVVASFYPLEYVTHRIAGDSVQLTDLTAPGVEPHDLELTPRQVAAIGEADLVVYEAGLQPSVDQAVEQNAGDHGLDVAPLVSLDGKNPHFWLDPERLKAAAVAIEKRLVAARRTEAPRFAANLARLEADLDQLDRDYSTGLTGCARTTIVTSHDAFGYLARYGLRFAPIAGLSPDAEPSTAHLSKLQDLIRSDGLTTVFSEPLASSKMANALSHDLGLRTESLDPLEGVRRGQGNYLSIMRDNLAKLRAANGCTGGGTS